MRYKATKVHADGLIFDSKHEFEVYRERVLAQRAGEITKLQIHTKFTLIVSGVVICTFKPDFVFHDKDDRVCVWDAKGFKVSKKTGKRLPRVDREFHIKANLMRACFGLEVEIV